MRNVNSLRRNSKVTLATTDDLEKLVAKLTNPVTKKEPQKVPGDGMALYSYFYNIQPKH